MKGKKQLLLLAVAWGISAFSWAMEAPNGAVELQPLQKNSSGKKLGLKQLGNRVLDYLGKEEYYNAEAECWEFIEFELKKNEHASLDVVKAYAFLVDVYVAKGDNDTAKNIIIKAAKLCGETHDEDFRELGRTLLDVLQPKNR